MKSAKPGWLLAFIAVFAVLAGFVFWGTWSTSVVPVMPDCPTSFSVDRAGDFCRLWLQNGKFVPGDAVEFTNAPYFWVELKYVLALFSAAFALSYFLIGRGLSRFASYSAGLFLAFSGYWCTLFSAGHLGWFQWMTYGVFAFGLIDRMLGKGKLRHCMLLGAVVAWGSFYQADLWLLFTLLTAAYFVFRSLTVRPGWKPWILRSLIALAVFASVGFTSFRSAFVSDLAGRDKQIDEGQTLAGGNIDPVEKRWRFVTNWSMPPEDTFEFFVPGVHGDTSCPMTLAIGNMRGNGIEPYTGRLGRPLMPDGTEAPAGNYRQHSLYVGWLTCILALFGIASAFFKTKECDCRVNRSIVVFFAVAAVVSWLFSMGRYAESVYRAVFALPFGDYLRAPVKWHHLTEFSIVVLAAFGLDFAWRLVSRYGVYARAALVAVALYGAFDLAGEARLYCAPHTADTLLGPLPQPLPPDADQRASFIRQVRDYGLNPVGTMKSPFRMRDGSVRELERLVVEQKSPRPRPSVRDRSRELKGFAFVAAVLSLAVTFGVLAFLAASLYFRRLERIRIS